MKSPDTERRRRIHVSADLASAGRRPLLTALASQAATSASRSQGRNRHAPHRPDAAPRARRVQHVPATRGRVVSALTVAGLLLIVVPIAFNVAFALLATRFDYPDILRQPTPDVLAQVPRGRHVAGADVVGLRAHRRRDGPTRRGALQRDRRRRSHAALARPRRSACSPRQCSSSASSAGRSWSPTSLAPTRTRTREARREAVDLIFGAFNRYLGVGVGEHLGYLLTGAWTTLIGVALTQSAAAPALLGVVGIVIGLILMLCSLEFVGKHEPGGWKLAEKLTPITYIAWSLWLIATRRRTARLIAQRSRARLSRPALRSRDEEPHETAM